MEFDSSVTQDDIDASGLGAAQSSSSSGFADDSDPSEGEQDYTTKQTTTISPDSYMETRGATVTNPFPESIFSKIFGAENVDYTSILGS